jgi:hypothetical protein
MTRPGQAPGPFDTEQQARQLPAVREVYRKFDRDPGVGKMAPHNLRMLLDALAAAGVYVGRYDLRIAEWLAGWEPATVAVIAGWVQRASQADGQAAARADGLLARMRDGPPVPCHGPGGRQKPQTSPRLNASTCSISQGADTGQAPREAAP